MTRSSQLLRASHGSAASKLGGRAADLLDLVDVERLDQRLAVREVAGRACRSRPRRGRAIASSDVASPPSANASRAAVISFS